MVAAAKIRGDSKMNENSIKGIFQALLDGIEGIADVNTIVGQAVETKDGTVIIPVSKLSIGFGASISEFPAKDKPSNSAFGGGGGGFSIDPVAFLVVSPDGNVRLMDMEGSSNITANILGAVPNLVENLLDTLGKKNK